LLLSNGEEEAPTRDLTTGLVFSASMLEFSAVSETLDCPEEHVTEGDATFATVVATEHLFSFA
jgi:hypothetical protein